MWTSGPLDVSHALHERCQRLDHRGLRGRHAECATCRGEMRALMRRAEQAIVANALEPTRQHVLTKAFDELAAGQTQGAPLAALAALQTLWGDLG